MLHRPQGEPVVPIVVVLRIDAPAVEVQVPCVAGRVPSRGPVVAVRPSVVPRAAIAVARAGEEQPLKAVYCDNCVGCHLYDWCCGIHEAEATARLYFFTPPTEV